MNNTVTCGMVYASDLDRTLIFSSKYLTDNPSDGNMFEVERYSDDFAIFMDADVRKKLRQLDGMMFDLKGFYSYLIPPVPSDMVPQQQALFIPVTSRSLPQYERLNLGFIPKYAITSCGGVILKDGYPIPEWEAYVNDSIDKSDAMHMMEELRLEGYEVRFVDEIFLFFKDKGDGNRYLNIIREHKKWSYTKQGNKVYVTACNISKESALSWLMKCLGNPYLIASGDGKMDLPMLYMADMPIVPNKSYITEENLWDSEKKFLPVYGGIKSPLETFELISKAKRYLIKCTNH